VNIGLVFWLPETRVLRHEISARYKRLSGFFGTFDGAGYRNIVRHLTGRLQRMASQLGSDRGQLIGPEESLADLDFCTLLEMVVREDASCIQKSRIRGGLATNPDEVFAGLYREFVGRFEQTSTKTTRGEEDVWQ
jgi:hypothetical protein